MDPNAESSQQADQPLLPQPPKQPAMPPESLLPSPDLSPTPPPSSPPPETAYTAALPHNATHSLLHRLPLELLTHLTTHHLSSSPADLLALRATSNDFRHNPLISAPPFSSPPTPSFSSSHRAAVAAAKDFRARLARDDTRRAFLRSCAAERAALNFRPWPASPDHLRPCAGCVAHHPRHWFSAAQLRVDPEMRRCRGTEGPEVGRTGGTPVCAHEVLSFHQVRALREEAKRNTPGDFRWVCGREGCRGELVFPRKWRELVWARRMVEVRGVRGGVGVTREVVWGWLRVAEEVDGVFVCRHVKLGVPESFESEWVGLGRRWEDGGGDGGGGGGGGGGGKISIHRCRVRTCNVKVSLSWTRVETGGGDGPLVELDILRYFGELESPIEEQWCAQLQHAEER